MKSFKAKPVDFQRCILRACRVRNTSIAKASIKAGMCRTWMAGVAHRNRPTLETMLLCSSAFEMELVELLTICDSKNNIN